MMKWEKEFFQSMNSYSLGFFCLLPSFCLPKRTKRHKNSMCNRSYPCMLLGCKIFPALDGVRAFTNGSSCFKSLRDSQSVSLYFISCARLLFIVGSVVSMLINPPLSFSAGQICLLAPGQSQSVRQLLGAVWMAGEFSLACWLEP